MTSLPYLSSIPLWSQGDWSWRGCRGCGTRISSCRANNLICALSMVLCYWFPEWKQDIYSLNVYNVFIAHIINHLLKQAGFILLVAPLIGSYIFTIKTCTQIIYPWYNIIYLQLCWFKMWYLCLLNLKVSWIMNLAYPKEHFSHGWFFLMVDSWLNLKVS